MIRNIRNAALAVCLAAGVITPAGAQSTPAAVDVCFVPAESCVTRIVAAIDAAETQIRVQAYGFTARPVLDALLRAKDRGVDVAALLDRSNERGRHPGLSAMVGGIPVWIDTVTGIAHIKAIMIDQRLVIGGSYNYTASAERRNVEDVTFTRSPDIAERFLTDWGARQAVARAPD